MRSRTRGLQGAQGAHPSGSCPSPRQPSDLFPRTENVGCPPLPYDLCTGTELGRTAAQSAQATCRSDHRASHPPGCPPRSMRPAGGLRSHPPTSTAGQGWTVAADPAATFTAQAQALRWHRCLEAARALKQSQSRAGRRLTCRAGRYLGSSCLSSIGDKAGESGTQSPSVRALLCGVPSPASSSPSSLSPESRSNRDSGTWKGKPSHGARDQRSPRPLTLRGAHWVGEAAARVSCVGCAPGRGH